MERKDKIQGDQVVGRTKPKITSWIVRLYSHNEKIRNHFKKKNEQQLRILLNERKFEAVF